MTFHAPSKASFVTSFIIAVIAGLSALSPVPYITHYAIWVAILAYIVLATSSGAQTNVARLATQSDRAKVRRTE